MKEIIHHNFSLFQIEKNYPSKSHNIVQSCFIHIDTFNSLDEAKLAQKDIEMKTIILPSY